jgi:type VI secretion system protein ImpF
MNPREATTNVTLSVWDRLADESTAPTQEVFKSRHQKVLELRTAVLRDVADLLNTRRPPVDLSDYGELEKSLYSYGLPDMTGMSLQNAADHTRLRRLIESAIRTFEPRLSGVQVSVEAVDKDRFALRFKIRAMLQMDPEPQPIVFDTVLENDNTHFEVKGNG